MAQTDLRYTFDPACNASDDPRQHVAFDVVEFKLVEGLSECYRLEVELLSSNPAIDFGLLLDQGATFTIWQGGAAVRQIHGLISELSQGNTGHRRTRYRALVEPQLARTRLRSDWRIFQQQTVPAILAEIFKADQIPNHAINTQSEHLQREYCVQAGDTDYDFIARLTAEEGFIYRFSHSQGNHQLLLTDAVQSYGAIGSQETSSGTASNTDGEQQATPAQTILYQPTPGGDRPQPALRTFTYQEQVRTASQTQRDYTFKNPPYTQQHSRYGQNLDHQSQHYERYDYPGRYKQDAAGEPFTQTRIQSLRRDARIAIAQGDDARLEPGLAFQLTGHTREDMNALWRPIHIEHSGTQHTAGEEEAAGAQISTSYEQKAVLVPATADWKAPLLPKPLITGPQSAMVVGPEKEEIFCDEWGRVKVQFPWDRLGKNDQHSSCWIRVAQNWAGAKWGHMAIPRIGQEVIVDFFDGDPDQPIITGRTYNALNQPPYELPQHKTKMTIKSQTHKGHGFNELTFEDEKDQEEIYIHAQRNKRIHVEHDKSELVEHDETRSISHNQIFTVGNDRTKKIGQDEMLDIGRDRKEHIGQDVFVTIGRNEDRKILSSQREEITASHILSVGENETVTIEGIQSIEAKTRLQTLTKDYVLQGEDRILIRGPNGKIIFDANGITIETPMLHIRAAVTMSGPGSDQVDAIKAAIQQGSPFVEECPNKKQG